MAAPRDVAGDIGRSLEQLAAGDLVNIAFLRVYSGPPLPPDRKSVSWRLTVGAADRTLSTDEVNAIRDRIIAGMREAGFELRV
jgi:phenylalanyl-tRNA synthetase beta chain